MRLLSVGRFASLFLFSLFLAACGSSGGGSHPPAPPAPVTPPPPPPEPAFEKRLADWAQHDPNACRALTPGFEALGGWLKNDGREPGTSRVWISDVGELSDGSSHGTKVWATFTACAVRSAEDHYFTDTAARAQARMEDGRDAIYSLSAGALRPSRETRPYPTPTRLPMDFDGERDGQRVLQFQGAGNDGLVTAMLWISSFQAALEAKDTALWVLVAGYTGTGNDRSPDPNSSICGEADPLCLFAPFEHDGTRGTSISAPQAAAALDTVWAVWPDMDILDLRNLAFDCAEDMPAPAGEEPVTRSYSYKNGRTFTSNTNSRWGHGILSLTCLFTPNGGLQNPVTGNPISGGIYGPVAGVVTGATITGVDYTGRDFGYGFAYPVARENWALTATANPSTVKAISGVYGPAYARGAYSGRLWESRSLTVDLTAAGNAISATASWQVGGLTLRGGMALQPEGVGPLSGSRAFRAPAAASAALTAAYGKALPRGFSAHLQADYWRTLATQGRSLWEGAELRESRLSAALVKRFGLHELSLQGVWRSGLAGSLDVSGRSWALSPQAESGVWLAWRRMPAQ